MQAYRSLNELPAEFGPSVAVIGNFDGVHLGHQHLLQAAISEAKLKSARSVAVTFDPHPEHFLRPGEAPGLLTLIPERLRLLSMTGIDAVLVLTFNEALAGLTARQFVQDILVSRLRIVGLHEGPNFRFGHRAEAGVEELAAFGREFGFTLTVHDALRIHGLEISSSAVRTQVTAGEMTRARWMLGYPFQIISTQARGRGIGTRLLVPTVNLAEYRGLLPANGVYITRLIVGEGGHCFQGITNAGDRPTFGEASYAVETHLLDYRPEVEPLEITPDTPLRLQFLRRLRGEEHFPSPEALKTQIGRDIGQAQRFHRLAQALDSK